MVKKKKSSKSEELELTESTQEELEEYQPLGEQDQSNYTNISEDTNATDEYFGKVNEESSINDGFSKVAQSDTSKKALIVGLAMVMIVTLYMVYQNFQKETKVAQTPSDIIRERSETAGEKLIESSTKAIPDKVGPTQSAPAITTSIALPTIEAPKAPEPPPAPAPSAPNAPVFPTFGGGGPSDPNAPPLPTFQPGAAQGIEDKLIGKNEEERKKKLEERRRSSIMVLGGGGNDKSKGDDKGSTSKDDPNKDDATKNSDDEKKKDKSAYLGFGEGAFGESALSKTSASQVSATYIGRLDTIIAQGKVINAVLENSINTDLPGPLRAIVSRDVYSESGKNVLIPKGSRVIGAYESTSNAGQTRVAVNWTRLIRPDGVDIALASPGTDNLGRAGIAGYYDNKFIAKLGNAILISFVLPKVTDKLFNVDKSSPITTTTGQNATTGTTATTTTSTVGAQQAQESTEEFKDIITKAIEEGISTKPVIFIDQGTEITILVAKDLVFPNEGTNNILIK
jgi:type IV secretion system protein VirB10